ncbi:MAG: hypothetical protein KME30_14225 [Iphinoe sp. HA4291-MV1]|jgi:hypothetical protein|nr:hypothetical protein [Iphinoe sp. HA4291-MV1]
MAKNTGNGYRRGAVDKRSQTYNRVHSRAAARAVVRTVLYIHACIG